jgi:hypothetical protein
LIEIESSTVVQSSLETVWRHLTRVSEWPRWYPGLHGVDVRQPVTTTGVTWRASGQIGRMLYRSTSEVTGYDLLRTLEVSGDRRPWIRRQVIEFRLEREGHSCRLHARIAAEPGFGFPGRLFLSRVLRRRLQREAEAICLRFSGYVGRALPHH